MSKHLLDAIHRSRRLLENPYAYLDGDGQFSASDSNELVRKERLKLENQHAFSDEHGGVTDFSLVGAPNVGSRIRIDPAALLKGRDRGGNFTRTDLESIARTFHVALWRATKFTHPISGLDILNLTDPAAALRSIGYTVEVEESLGTYVDDAGAFEVAGMIDRVNCRVSVSTKYSPSIRRFTLAHELGHAILHTQLGLHRERALDGSTASRRKHPAEVEADGFACCFLMPRKQVELEFEARFLTRAFVLDDESSFALRVSTAIATTNRIRTLRDLTEALATARQYNGVDFQPLNERFGVSEGAMAIRLEELGLARAP